MLGLTHPNSKPRHEPNPRPTNRHILDIGSILILSSTNKALKNCGWWGRQYLLFPEISGSESEKSTLVYNTKPVFVFDSEWVKVTVAFDQNNEKVTTQDEPVTVVIIFMLGICLVNCLHCPPKFLQDHPFSFHSSSFSLVKGNSNDDPAQPEDEVLTIAQDTPIE